MGQLVLVASPRGLAAGPAWRGHRPSLPWRPGQTPDPGTRTNPKNAPWPSVTQARGIGRDNEIFAICTLIVLAGRPHSGFGARGSGQEILSRGGVASGTVISG